MVVVVTVVVFVVVVVVFEGVVVDQGRTIVLLEFMK